jgi:hypothetical protein
MLEIWENDQRQSSLFQKQLATADNGAAFLPAPTANSEELIDAPRNTRQELPEYMKLYFHMGPSFVDPGPIYIPPPPPPMPPPPRPPACWPSGCLGNGE